MEVDVPEDLPLVSADPGLLQRVLVNVFDNAVRHGGGDEPIRSAPRQEPTAPRSRSSTTARESRGAARAHVRALPARRRPWQAGVGLGLSVARGFVEAMGGAMVADSTPGGGVTMRIRLRSPGRARPQVELDDPGPRGR